MIKKLKGISKCTVKDKFDWIVHVSTEYDYQFDSDNRDEIIASLKYVYHQDCGHNLAIFHVPKEFTKADATQKADIAKGHEVPLPTTYREKSEDLYAESGTGTTAGKTFSLQTSQGSIDEMAGMNTELRSYGPRGQSIYQRVKTKTPAKLDDFEVKSVIGKGSFGKVFLVENKNDKHIYAMKSLKKSVIIEYDQVESTKLEKDILMQADHPFLVGMEYVFQTELKIFFVMKFVRGGELFMHLRKARQFKE